MKYLLDTDHLSIIQRQAGTDYSTLATRLAKRSRTDLALSVVSFHEQVMGCHAYIARASDPINVVQGYRMLSRLLGDFSAVSVLPFDSQAASTFATLLTQKIRIGTMDLRIASIALSRGLILLTRNLKDFRQVPTLITEDWTIQNADPFH